jgi:hypothetical protein
MTKVAIAITKTDLPTSDPTLACTPANQGLEVAPGIWSSARFRQDFDLVVVRSC